MAKLPKRPVRKRDAVDVLIASERAALDGYGVKLSNVALTFTRDLDEEELRRVWNIVSAIARRRPESEGHPGFLIGDWANEADRRLGDESSYRIIKEEDAAYAFSQHLLAHAGATLMSLQLTEYAIACCCRLIEPKDAEATVAAMFSPEVVSRRRTLGQLNQEIKKRKIFLDEFEQRMESFIKRRNKFAHYLLVSSMHLAHSEHAARIKGFRELDEFLSALLLEAHDVAAVFFGLITAIGVTVGERENVQNLELWLSQTHGVDWREHLKRFGAVQRPSK